MRGPEKHSEKQIIRGCLKNDRKYQEILYRKFAPQMFTLSLAYTKDRHIAKDILQEGFIKVFNKIATFNNEGALGGWIRKIIVNTAIDHLRKLKNEFSLMEMEEGDEGAGPVDETLLQSIDLEDILYQLDYLPDGARIIFNLFAIEGYTHREIAVKLNITEGTSKSQFNRARKLLQKLIIRERIKANG